MTKRLPRFWLALALAFSTTLSLTGVAVAQQQTGARLDAAATPAVRAALLPTGKLRVGLYPGSPSSLIPGNGANGNRGVGFELGQALATAIGVEFVPVIFQSNGEVLAAAKEAKVDFVFTNATPARAAFLDFVDPLVVIEQGYLVGPKSATRAADQIDRAEVSVGVSPGSTSQATLPGILKNAKLVVVKNLQTAAQMLNAGELDAFASNKGILYDLSDKVPGSTVLEGAWGFEQLAIGIPRGREAALPLVRQFSQEAKSSGLVAAAAQRAAMRGVRAN